jgi:hypothetical protein
VEKLDLKKQLKHLCAPSAKQVSLVDVPQMRFIAVDGSIERDETPGTSPDFAHAIGAMYGFAYTLKFMSKMRAENPVDYGVMALEGLWTTPTGGEDYRDTTDWQWTLLIMQPAHVDRSMFEEARVQLRRKREKEVARAAKAARGSESGASAVAATEPVSDSAAALAWIERVSLDDLREGLCVQIMHIGPYADEPGTLAKMSAFAEQNGYVFHGPHHEIYLGDPRTAKPENLRTVLRHAVRPAP